MKQLLRGVNFSERDPRKKQTTGYLTCGGTVVILLLSLPSHNSMPGIIRRPMGTASKSRESKRLPPEKGWECFYENKEEEEAAPAPAPKPRRRRKSSKATDMFLQELVEESRQTNHKAMTAASLPIPAHLQGTEEEGPPNNDDTKAASERTTTTETVTPSTGAKLLGYLPSIASTVSQVQSSLTDLVSSVQSVSQQLASASSSSFSNAAGVLSKLLDLVERLEATTQRQEANDSTTIQDLKSQVQKLQKEAQERNAVIVELQKSQEEERKESQERFAEALQRLTEVQAEKDALSAAVACSTKNPERRKRSKTHQSSWPIPYTKTGTAKTAIHNTHESSSEDSFGTPRGAFDEEEDDEKSDDSPFSTTGASIPSNKAVSQRKRRITPGATLARASKKQNLKDFVPHFPRSYGSPS